MRMFSSVIAILAFFLVTARAEPVQRASHPIEQNPALAFLLEIVCPAGPSGVVVPAALSPGCGPAMPRRRDHVMGFHRHDWPANEHRKQYPKGYHRSSGFLEDGRIIQTFDFGTGPRRFGNMELGAGDGGQAIELTGDVARVYVTEDGKGLHWFRGARCRDANLPERRSGWLLFAGEPGPQWSSDIAELRIAKSRDECPLRFDRSFTRWRLVDITWPIAISGKPEPLTLPTIISEHFGSSTIEASSHIERFYLAKGIGLIRWEKWWNRQSERKRPNAEQAAARLRPSGRCPDVKEADALGSNWIMVDCRMWSNFIPAENGQTFQEWVVGLPPE